MGNGSFTSFLIGDWIGGLALWTSYPFAYKDNWGSNTLTTQTTNPSHQSKQPIQIANPNRQSNYQLRCTDPRPKPPTQTKPVESRGEICGAGLSAARACGPFCGTALLAPADDAAGAVAGSVHGDAAAAAGTPRCGPGGGVPT